jgi:hypothetical protein
VKVGDLVKPIDWQRYKDEHGIIVELHQDPRVPQAAVILWGDGTFSGMWLDDLEIIK